MDNWKTAKGEKISLQPEIYKTLMSNIDKELTVYIATDSQQKGLYTKFATLVVVRLGNNGCRVFVNVNKVPRIGRIIPRGEKFGPKDFSLLRQRLLKESELTIETARIVEIVLYLVEDDYFTSTGRIRKLNLRVEADVNTNPKYNSNKFLKEIVGYIKGCGFEVFTKPNSLMASNAADKFAKS